MKYRPDDAELLAAIAELLEDQVMAAVPPALQHQVRVAANLARIMERGQAVEPGADERARRALANLLGGDRAEVGVVDRAEAGAGDGPAGGDLGSLTKEVDDRIETGRLGHTGAGDGPAGGDLGSLTKEVDDRIETGRLGHAAVWDALVAICRDDLAVAKPGYDVWEGE